jgi:hypothetical protein
MCRIALAILALVTLSAAGADLDQTIAATDRIRTEANAKVDAAWSAWLATVDLTPVAVPELGTDPRASEVKAAAEVASINRLLDAVAIAAKGHRWHEVADLVQYPDAKALFAKGQAMHKGKK